MIDKLTPAEQTLFEDPAIEAAYQTWSFTVPGKVSDRNHTRKQFVMRLRAFFQSGRADQARALNIRDENSAPKMGG